MHIKCNLPHVTCGRVFQPELVMELDASEPPIVLAELTVNTKYIQKPCVFIKFSEFIHFTILGINPKLDIFYRLISKDEKSIDAQILQEWEFLFESTNVSEIANVDTNQPTVLNYCDCLDPSVGHVLTYKIEVIGIDTNNVREYSITNKSITATVMSRACQTIIFK